ncbi:glyceraldehyde-3-phosphate dehydrogenase [Phytophthora cinnamomi]|uniref:glyceraldehyde-3-phosphate dehydrogenase n=1 Tax=Phytophthora cinnamomi TaxID=4785 RepID=UPI0035593F24|nr:glyceraldehyde-3-phosphate dehydrogenase [Phytophthora cinnamomi]
MTSHFRNGRSGRPPETAHIEGGCKKVVISAPPKDATPNYVKGVNHKEYDGSAPVVSNASCTTNCLAPMTKMINDKSGIVEGLMTTMHATAATQLPVDGPAKDGKDWRRPWLRPEHHPVVDRRRQGRGQGAAWDERQADGHGITRADARRVGGGPDVPPAEPASMDYIKAAVKAASEGELVGILGYTENRVVSNDFLHDM